MAESTNPHANLIIGAQDEATPVFGKIKDSSQSMAAGVEQAATKAAGAVGGIGDKAAPAAQKLDSVTTSMIRQVQRLNAELESGGARNAAYIEKMASIKGADLSALAPYLADLKKAEAAQRVATTGLDNMGLSAKQTTAALRGVPAQFTDIITSLQGGQAPMTVLLQQGGQLKDMFGGVGNAAKALGGYVLGLVNPITVTAAALGAVGFAAYKGSKEWEEYNRALILTGNAVGVTATQLNNMAASVAKSTGGTQGAAAEALVALTNSTGIASSNFKRFAEVAVVTQRDVGTAIAETVKQFNELGKDPLKKSLELNEATNFLTVSIYQQIKALEEQGRKAEAASVAQNALAKAREDQAAAMRENLGYLERGWKSVEEAAKGAWDAMLDVGRHKGPTDAAKSALAAAEQALERARDKAGNGGLRGQEQANAEAHVKRMERAVAARQQELVLQEKGAGYEALSAAYQQQGAARLDAQVAFDKQHDQFLSKRVQMERELLAVRTQAAKANEGADAQTIAANRIKLAEAEAGIRKKFAEAAKPDAWVSEVAKAYAKAMSELDAEQIKASSSADKLSKTQEALRRVQSGPEWAAMSRRQQEEVIMAASLSQAEEDRLDTMRAAEAENAKYIAGLTESATAHESKRQALSDEVAAYKVAIEKNISLAEAIEEVALARLQEQKAIEMSYGNDKAVEQLNREIKARKELAALKGVKADHAAEVEAGKAAAAATLAEWKRGWDETDRLAREVFTTWATDGSNAAQKIGDTLKKALLSAIYEATLKPLVFQLYTSIAGVPPGGGSGGLSGAGSLYSMGSKVADTVRGWLGMGGATGGSATKAALYGDLGYTGAASGSGVMGSMSSTLSSIPIAGWIAMGMMASSQAYDQGFRSDTSSKGLNALNPNHLLNFTDRGLQGMGIDARTAAILSGSALGSAAEHFVFGGSTVTDLGSGIMGTLGGSQGSHLATYDVHSQDHRGVLGIGSYTTENRDNWKDADAQVAQFVNDQVKLVTDAARKYGTALGLPVDKLDDFKKQIDVSLNGLDAAGVQKALQGAIDGFANDLVSSSFGDSLKDVAREGETSAQTLTRLSADLTGVNQVFDSVGHHLLDVSVSGAAAASGLVQAAGGLSNLQSQLQSMYAQLASAQQDLADANRNAYDLMVESQDQANKVLGNDSGGGGGGSSNAMAEAIKYLADLKTGIQQWIDKLNSTQEGGLGLQAQRDNAWAALQTQLVLARGGDRTALSGITGYASTYIGAVQGTARTSVEEQIAIGRVKAELAKLPDQVPPEKLIVDAINSNGGSGGAVATAVKSLGNKLTAELTVSARSEIVKMIEFVTDTDKLPYDLKQLALASADTMTKTVSFITGSKLTEENKQLALGTSSQLTKTINYGLGLDIPDEYKRIALKANDSIEKTISYTARNVLDPKQAALALMADNTIVKTLELAAGRLDPEALKVAYAQSETIRKMIEASGGVLTEDQQMLLNNVVEYNKQVNLQVHLDENALTAAEDFLQTRFSTLDIKTVLKANDPMTVLRDFINSQISGGINGIAVYNVYQAAKTYGFTQQDIANAMGRSLAEVENIFGQYGIPKFAVGADYIPQDMLAVVHKGEQIVPAAYNPNAAGNQRIDTGALERRIEALQADARVAQATMAALMSRLVKLNEKWDGDGLPETRSVAA